MHNEFKIGDKVIIINGDKIWQGFKGKIVRLNPQSSYLQLEQTYLVKVIQNKLPGFRNRTGINNEKFLILFGKDLILNTKINNLLFA